MASPFTGPRSLPAQQGTDTVTIASGAGTLAVTFSAAFTRIPHVLVIQHAADVDGSSATYSATSITVSGFTISVASSGYTDGDIKVSWIAVEKV